MTSLKHLAWLPLCSINILNSLATIREMGEKTGGQKRWNQLMKKDELKGGKEACVCVRERERVPV